MSMTRIWRETGFVNDDPWIFDEDHREMANGRIVHHFKDFLDTIESETNSSDTFGVLIRPDDDVSRLVPYLDRIALIAVSFPAFNDGRAFSQAALLRARYDFRGEIRAVGDVLIDQIPLMLRCGIDSFSVTNAIALKRLEKRYLNGIPLHYQPAARPGGEQRAEAYSWRRRA